MSGEALSPRARPATAAAADRRPMPLVWTFDGPLGTCLMDLEDTLRRAIVQIGDASRIAVSIDLSLPALRARVRTGDSVQPAWGEFLDRVSQRYGLPAPPRVRPSKSPGALLSLVIVYRS